MHLRRGGNSNRPLWQAEHCGSDNPASAQGLQQEVINPEIEPVLRFDNRTSIAQKMSGPDLTNPPVSAKARSCEVEIHAGRVVLPESAAKASSRRPPPTQRRPERPVPRQLRLAGVRGCARPVCISQLFTGQFSIHQLLLKPVSVERMNRKWLTSVGQLLVLVKPQAQTLLQKK